MSPLFISALLAFFVLVFSQFGSRLAARHSASWYLVSAFILVAVIRPELLRPLADLFGIALISNMVLAVLTMFLFVQMLEHYSEAARSHRQVVQLVSSLAVSNFSARSLWRGDAPRVLVVLPCYNEEDSIPRMVPRLREIQEQTKDLDVTFCFVNDGSSDGTADVLERCAPGHAVTHHTNIGVAGALRTGFKIANREAAEWVVQCDSDGQHPVESIPTLVRTAQELRTDLLIGSRFTPTVEGGTGSSLASTTWMRRFGGLIVSAVLGLFGRSARVTDPTSGFRVYSPRAIRELLRFMPDEYPEPESVAVVALRDLRVQEVRVDMAARETGVSSLSGVRSLQFMVKVTAALLGLRLRSLMGGLG